MAMSDGFVKWFYWGQNGLINYGQMRKCEVATALLEFEKQAKKVLERTGADHVLYGVKRYDENGQLEKITFYMEPMTDEQFEQNVASLNDCVVYALHAIR